MCSHFAGGGGWLTIQFQGNRNVWEKWIRPERWESSTGACVMRSATASAQIRSGHSVLWRGSRTSVFHHHSESHSVMSDSLQAHALCSPWHSPGQNTGVGSLSFLQWIFPAQGSNPGLPHCRQILYQLSHQGSSRILEWVAYPFSSRSSWPRNRTGASCIAGGFFTNWAIREVPWPLCLGPICRREERQGAHLLALCLFLPLACLDPMHFQSCCLHPPRWHQGKPEPWRALSGQDAP